MLSRRIIPGFVFALAAATVPAATVCAQVSATLAYAAMATLPDALRSVTSSARRAEVHQLDDEVQLLAPSGPVMLAHGFELKLAGETTTLSRISITQWTETESGEWREIYQGFSSGPGERRGDAVVVTVVPYQLGRVQLRVTGVGRAGKQLDLLHKDVWIDVAAPAVGPVELRFGEPGHGAWDQSGGRIALAKIGLKRHNRPLRTDLSVKAIYNGVLEPQPLDARRVQYRVRTGQQGAVIALDERTGSVRGLKAGHALVEASYGGMTKQACVVVQDAGSSHTGCESLAKR